MREREGQRKRGNGIKKKTEREGCREKSAETRDRERERERKKEKKRGSFVSHCRENGEIVYSSAGIVRNEGLI